MNLLSAQEKYKDFVGKENKTSRKMYFSSYSPVLTIWPDYKTDFLYDKVKSRYTNSFQNGLAMKKKKQLMHRAIHLKNSCPWTAVSKQWHVICEEITYLYELPELQDNCPGPPELSRPGPIYLITCHFKFLGF